jgi:hypothetical protein
MSDMEWRGFRVYLGHGSSTHPDMAVKIPGVGLFGVEVRVEYSKGRQKGLGRRKKPSDDTDYYAWVHPETRRVEYEATRPDLPRFWETKTTNDKDTHANADSEAGLRTGHGGEGPWLYDSAGLPEHGAPGSVAWLGREARA